MISSKNPTAIDEDWQKADTNGILDPERAIIDCHHHLWDRPGSRYLNEEFLIDLNSGHRIDQTVFVQCRTAYDMSQPVPLQPVGETRFVAKLAEEAKRAGVRTSIAAGIVGYADLMQGAEAAQTLDGHLEAGGDRFKGIRHITCHDEDPHLLVPNYPTFPGMLADPTFRAGFACLGKRGLSFDAMVYHHEIHELADLANSFEGTQIIMDHVGVPLGANAYASVKEETFTQWRASVQKAARCPNLTVKLGGLGIHYVGMNFDHRTDKPSAVELAKAYAPYIETCIEAFGPERCMFESNFPVERASSAYRDLWNAFKLIAYRYTEDEKTQLFHGAAKRIYRLS